MDVVALAQHGVEYAVATLGHGDDARPLAEALPPHRHRGLLLRRRRRGAQGGVARARKHAAGARRRQERGLPVPARRRGSRRLRPQARQGGVRGALRRVPRRCPNSCWASCRSQHPPTSAEGRAALVAAARPYLAQLTAPVLSALLRRRLADLDRAARSGACASCCTGDDAPCAAAPSGDAASDRAPAGPRGPGQRRAPSLVRELIQGLLLQPELARTEARARARRRHRRRRRACRPGRVLRRR